jgi:cell division protein FtsL
MNTAINSAVRSINTYARPATQVSSRSLSLSNQPIGIALLLAAIFLSALAVVYVQAINRILYSEVQSLEKTQESLGVEWSQLLLEQNTWATQARIQEIADQKLQMVVPEQKDIVIVTD